MSLILQNLNNLVQIPTGCGEQNMLLFTPNIHVLNYLNSFKIQNKNLREEVFRNMKIGYERQQNYRRKDGSYSAFGDMDDEGSLWLTAFIIRSFAQARTHIYVDQDKLMESMQWIISHQYENGCFPTVGTILHQELLVSSVDCIFFLFLVIHTSSGACGEGGHLIIGCVAQNMLRAPP